MNDGHLMSEFDESTRYVMNGKDRSGQCCIWRPGHGNMIQIQ